MGIWRALRDWLFDSPATGASANQQTDTRTRGGVTAGTRPADRTSQSRDGSAEPWWTPGESAARDLPRHEPRTLSTPAAGLDRLLGAIQERDDLQLPPTPSAASRVLQMLAKDSHDARQLAAEVANDEVASLAVLRQANSVLYRGREPVTDLCTAITRLGLTVLRTIMLQHSLRAAARPRRGDRHLAAIVWNGALASACIMRNLAELLRTVSADARGPRPQSPDNEAAYLDGLLHDVGNVLVLRETQEQQAVLRYQIDLDEFDWLCRAHHERLGRFIGDAWNLPDTLKTLIAAHHEPRTADTPPSVAMIALTDMLKAMLGYAPPASYDLLQSTPAQALGLTAHPAFIAFLTQLPDDLQHIECTFASARAFVNA